MGRVTIILIALLVIVGCSQPPEKEMAMAKRAIQDCQENNRMDKTYGMAFDSLAMANMEKNTQDQKFALFRCYGKARDMYLRVAVLANQAQTSTTMQTTSNQYGSPNKQKMIDLVTELKKCIENL